MKASGEERCQSISQIHNFFVWNLAWHCTPICHHKICLQPTYILTPYRIWQLCISLATSKFNNSNKSRIRNKVCVILLEMLPYFQFLKDFGLFWMHQNHLNYFVISVGIWSFCLSAVILHFSPLIYRAATIYMQKINNCGPPDKPLLLLEVTGLLVAAPVADQKI